MTKYILSPIISLPVWDLDEPQLVLDGLRAIYAALHAPNINYKQLYQTGILKEDERVKLAFTELASLIRVAPKRVANTLNRLEVSLKPAKLYFEDDKADTTILVEILMFLLSTQPDGTEVKFIIKRGKDNYIEQIVSKDGVSLEYYNSVLDIADRA